MKLVIGPKIQIGALEFNIYWNDALLEKMELQAYISSKDQAIRLAHRSPDKQWTNLIHEILHGITNEFDLRIEDEKVERYFSTFAHGLAIALNSLGVEPDFSQIPEESKG